MKLFRFLWVDWNWGVFLAFIWGVLFGIILIFGVYVINVLLSLRKSRYIMTKRVKQIDKTEVEALIDNAKNDYLVKRKEKDSEQGYLKSIIFGLVQDIAKLYYPKSKKPLAELTFDELVVLAHYITDTIDDILSRPALKIFKRMKLVTVLNILDIRKNKAVKKAQEINEKYKVTKVASTATMIYHAINPFYWFKKAVFDTSFALITKKITLVVIEVVGEQTNKVFSKEALVLEDRELNEMLESLDNDIDELQKENDETKEDDIKVSKAEKYMMNALAKADEQDELENKSEVESEKNKTREEKRKEREERRMAEEAKKDKEAKRQQRREAFKKIFKRKDKEAKK